MCVLNSFILSLAKRRLSVWWQYIGYNRLCKGKPILFADVDLQLSFLGVSLHKLACDVRLRIQYLDTTTQSRPVYSWLNYRPYTETELANVNPYTLAKSIGYRYESNHYRICNRQTPYQVQWSGGVLLLEWYR